MDTMRVIAAVRTDDEFAAALDAKVRIVFDLSPDLLTLSEKIEQAHCAGKRLFLHLDLATGIGKDKSGLLFLKQLGADGIISTRVNLIKTAKEVGLFAVQRFFIIDSHSVDTTLDALRASKADMIEVMPGIAVKAIRTLRQTVQVPMIAGGLITEPEEMAEAIRAGATAVSTGKRELWE